MQLSYDGWGKNACLLDSMNELPQALEVFNHGH